MRRVLLIGLIVCVLAMGGIGAAFATGMGFSNVGALSLGTGDVPQVNVVDVGWELYSGAGLGVVVDGVYLKLDRNIAAGTVIFISLRNTGWTELAYYAGVTTGAMTANTWYKFPLSDGTTALPAQVAYVKVTVAENGSYSTP